MIVLKKIMTRQHIRGSLIADELRSAASVEHSLTP